VKPLVAIAHVVTIDLRLFALVVHTEDDLTSLLLIELELVVAEVMSNLQPLVSDFACVVSVWFKIRGEWETYSVVDRNGRASVLHRPCSRRKTPTGERDGQDQRGGDLPLLCRRHCGSLR
jgi:hypothetical protein